MAIYLDSSALVKLVVEETESDALGRYVREHLGWASCSLARVEVVRAVRPSGREAVVRARQVLTGVDLIHLDDALLDSAANLGLPRLRSLDAIHLAAALALGSDLDALVTYDARMADAAEGLDFQTIVAPGR